MHKTIRKSRHGALFIIAGLGLTAALGGCGKPEAKPTGTVLVSMADNSYSPAIVRVPVGGSIVFMNVGRNDHNVFAVDKSWSSEKTFGNIKMSPGDMTEIVFTKEGVIRSIAAFMRRPTARPAWSASPWSAIFNTRRPRAHAGFFRRSR